MVEGNLFDKIGRFNNFIQPPFPFILNIKDKEDSKEKGKANDDLKKAWKEMMPGVSEAYKTPILETEQPLLIVTSNNISNTLTSMEQLWLAFVMKEKYNKVWDSERQDWIQTK